MAQYGPPSDGPHPPGQPYQPQPGHPSGPHPGYQQAPYGQQPYYGPGHPMPHQQPYMHARPMSPYRHNWLGVVSLCLAIPSVLLVTVPGLAVLLGLGGGVLGLASITMAGRGTATNRSTGLAGLLVAITGVVLAFVLAGSGMLR